MFLNPYMISPPKYQAWGQGYWSAFFSRVHPMPGPEIRHDDYHAFNEGVAAGANASVNGIATLANPCMPLLVSEPSTLTIVGAAGGTVWNIAKWSAKGFAGLFVTLLRASISLQTTFVDPEQFLRDQAPNLLNFLGYHGVHNAAVYMGGGIDHSARDCELQVTHLFPTQQQARDAVVRIGRQRWLIYEWRADQSGGLTIVDWKD
jgi:hypothetical protein